MKLSPEQIKKLNEPLPPEAVKPHPTKTYLSSIKAIYVVERLNDVFGIGGWFINNQFIEKVEKWVVVKSTFEAKEYGIIIPDIFGGNDNADLGDAYKGACTDALTKIGSYLGIGMNVYKGLTDKPTNGATMYNHKKIEDPGRPLIKNAQFRDAIDRINKGEFDLIEKLEKAFSFSPEQKTILESKKQTA
jgi:hypothetical protein